MNQEMTAEDRVIGLIRHTGTCDLEDLARQCPNLTWNQVFLVVDHLSRTGEVRLAPSKGEAITITLLPPQESRPDYENKEYRHGVIALVGIRNNNRRRQSRNCSRWMIV